MIIALSLSHLFCLVEFLFFTAGLERLRFSSKSDSPEMAILQALGLAASDHKSPWKHTLLYDGERIRWSSLPSDLLTALSLLLRYGADLWRSHLFVSRLLKHFDRRE